MKLLILGGTWSSYRRDYQEWFVQRCFEAAVTRLRAAGFKPFWHQRVPPNDGGIALGQVVAARQSTA